MEWRTTALLGILLLFCLYLEIDAGRRRHRLRCPSNSDRVCCNKTTVNITKCKKEYRPCDEDDPDYYHSRWECLINIWSRNKRSYHDDDHHDDDDHGDDDMCKRFHHVNVTKTKFIAYCCNGWQEDYGYCTIPVDVPVSIVCENGGTPSDDGTYCNCPANFQGTHCEDAICSPECQNYGACVCRDGQNYCLCPYGFTGQYCESAVCEKDCQNGGECDSDGFFQYCICEPGYTGEHCEEEVKSGDCPEPSVGTCVWGSSCMYDSHCADTKKCCFNGCGYSCMEPYDASTCLYNGTQYTIGDTIMKGPCEICTCFGHMGPYSDGFSCAHMDCPHFFLSFTCPPGMVLKDVPGVCCPQCLPEEPVTTPLPTTRAPESTPLPTTRAPASTQLPTTRAPTSTPLPTTRTPASTPLPTTRAPTSTPLPTTRPPATTPLPTTRTPASTPLPTTRAPISTPLPTTRTPASSPLPTTRAPTSTPLPTTRAPTSTPLPTTRAPTSTPLPTTRTPTSTPLPTTRAPTSTPLPTTRAPASTPLPTTRAPTSTPLPTTRAPTSTPLPTTRAPTTTPLPTTRAPVTTPLPVRGPEFKNCPTKMTTVHVNEHNVVNLKVALQHIVATDHHGNVLSLTYSTMELRHCACSETFRNEHQIIVSTNPDDHGRMATCAMIVKVHDPHPPTFVTCPSKIQDFDDEVISWVKPTVTDNVKVYKNELRSAYKNNTLFPNGNHMVTYVASDYEGNIAVCNFRVEIWKRDSKDPAMPTTLQKQKSTEEHEHGIKNKLHIILPVSGGIFLIAIAVILGICCRKSRSNMRDASQFSARGHTNATYCEYEEPPPDYDIIDTQKLPPYTTFEPSVYEEIQKSKLPDGTGIENPWYAYPEKLKVSVKKLPYVTKA